MGTGVFLHSFLISTLHSLAALPTGERAPALDRRLSCLQSQCGCFGEGTNLLPPSELNHNSLILLPVAQPPHSVILPLIIQKGHITHEHAVRWCIDCCFWCNKVCPAFEVSCLLTETATLTPCSSPSGEVNWFSAGQEISCILCNLKVHYCIYRNPPLVCILSHINPALASYPTSWRSTLILSSHLHLGLPNGLFPSGFLIKILYALLLSPIPATCPAYLIFLNLITETIFEAKIIYQSSTTFYYAVTLTWATCFDSF